MKKNFINLLFVSFFIFLIFPFCAKADGPDDYIINKYNVDINVNENNVLNITETIDVNFSQEKHGIYRKIPLKNTYYRKGIEATTKAKISNLSVNEQYSKEKINGNLEIKIGDPYNYVTGEKQYIIKYDYDIGDDNVDLYDDLYFNIIGTEWTTYIKDVTFKITMPKEFDSSLISFTSGSYGSIDNDSVYYNVEGNVITGNIKRNLGQDYVLSRGEGLTVRLELPEGYFQGERYAFDPTFIIIHGLLIFFLVLVIVSIILFKKFSYRKKDLLVVEYAVPDNLSPAEVGYLYDGSAKNKHIVSLITYFANKGYLEIISYGKKDFSFKKIKSIDDSEPDYAKKTFNGLFKHANSEGVVDKSDLEDTFYTTLSSAISSLSRTHKIYKTSHTLCGLLYIFMMVGPFFLRLFLDDCMSYKLEYYYYFQDMIVTFLVFVNFILGLIFLINNKKRTEETTKYYNKMRGFKQYMECVEKDKLEALVLDNPNYFYDILPYAYVLGVSSKWTEKFESITLAPPSWYSGDVYSPTTGVFDVVAFNNSLTNTLSKASNVMSSSPSSSSDIGGSGGGGFSGGGGGGGGGGSW